MTNPNIIAMSNKVQTISLTLSDAWDNKEAIKEQARGILKRAKDEKRDLTQAEATTFNDLISISEQIDEIVYRMAEAGGPADSSNGLMIPGDGRYTSMSKAHRHLFGQMALDLAKGDYGKIEERGLTSTTGAATIVNPNIMTDYFQTLTHMNPLSDLGVVFQRADNYSQWPYASGAPAIAYQGAEGDAFTPDTSWTLAGRKGTFVTSACIIKTSKQLLFDGLEVPQIISQELASAFQNSILTKFMTGSGSGEPTGLDNLSGIQTDDLNGSAFSYDDFAGWSATLLRQRVRPEQIGWLYSPSTWSILAKTTDDQSRYQDAPSPLRNQTWTVSSAVSEAYSTNTRSKIYGGNFSNSRVLFQGGSGFSGNGYGGMMVLDQLYSATFETGFLAWLRYDIQHFRPEQIIRVDGVPLT